MSLRLSGHSTYLTMALVKYPEALPTNGHFRLSLTLTVGFWSHQYTFRTLHPDPSGIPQLFVETSLFLESLGNPYLDNQPQALVYPCDHLENCMGSRRVFRLCSR